MDFADRKTWERLVHRPCMLCRRQVPDDAMGDARRSLRNITMRHFGDFRLGLTLTQVLLLADSNEMESFARASLCPYHQIQKEQLIERMQNVRYGTMRELKAHLGPMPKARAEVIESLFKSDDAPKVTFKLGQQLALPEHASMYCAHRAARQPLEGNICMFCQDDFMTPDCVDGQAVSSGQKTVWCKDGCGQNYHASCWGIFKASELKKTSKAAAVKSVRLYGVDVSKQLKCPHCQGPWVVWQDCACDEHKTWDREGASGIIQTVLDGLRKELVGLGDTLLERIDASLEGADAWLDRADAWMERVFGPLPPE